MCKTNKPWSLIFLNGYTYAYLALPMLLSIWLIGREWRRMFGSEVESCNCLALREEHNGGFNNQAGYKVVIGDTLTNDSFPRGSDRSHRCYYGCTFIGLHVNDVDLSVSRFDSCSFSGCEFSDCNFSNVDIDSQTVMTSCSWTQCDLSHAEFRPQLATFALFDKCNFHSCFFVPFGLERITLRWKDDHNLYYLLWLDRDSAQWHAFKNFLTGDSALKDAVREVAAGEKYRVVLRASLCEQLKTYVITGDFLSDFKTNFIKPVIPMVAMIPIFFLIYLRFSFGRTIYLTWTPSLRSAGKREKITVPLGRVVGKNYRRRAAAVFYFTLVSTLSFGYLVKKIDLQTLIAEAQKRDYSYELEGRIKTWSTLQSLIFMGCLLTEIAVWR
jgi:uncharacterized protein YjbI with pentapeptide repeats